MPDVPSPLVLQFLNWVAERPRTYADAMEAWQTSCPRMTIWEDALRAGYIEINAQSTTQNEVSLTLQGRAALESRKDLR